MMLERFANVVYWAATILALICGGFAYYLWQGPLGDAVLATIVLIFGVTVWLAGRAVLYVLAGR